MSLSERGLRSHALGSTIGNVPRFLWLGLIVCVAALVGALALMSDHEPREELVASTSAHVETLDRRSVELALAPSTGPSDRSSVAALPSDSKAPDSGADTRLSDYGYHGPDELEFHDGIVEVRVVRDEDGGPIEGASVTIEMSGASESAVTDATGSAVFTSVTVSRWGLGVSAVAPGRPPISSPVFIDPESRRAAVELRPFLEREVLVRIVDPLGLPFRPADWQIAREEAKKLGIVLGGECGRVGDLLEIRGAPTHRTRSAGTDAGAHARVVVIRGRGPACVQAVLGDTVVGATQIDPSASEALVRLDADALGSAIAPIFVRVLAAAGDVPIEGAVVAFEVDVPRDFELRTDADGRARVPFAYSGSVELVVTARGFAPGLIAVTRPFPPEFVARLVPGRRIEGRVVDQDGLPISGARIDLPGAGPGVAATMRSAADGVFRFHDLPSAEFRVQATYSAKSTGGGGQRVAATADCRERDVLDLRLEIPVAKSSTSAPPR